LRFEIEVKNNPKLNPTTLIIFRIDSLDRISLIQKIVGYAFFPLFVDKINGEQIKDTNFTNYALNSGMYQLQLYHQNPIMTKPITYAKFTKLEHIPCASLLIRVEKAARGENGNKIRKKDPASGKFEL